MLVMICHDAIEVHASNGKRSCYEQLLHIPDVRFHLCHWNEHPMCKVSLSLSLALSLFLVTDQDQQTTYNSLAADRYGKETGLRTKSPSWNDLRCLMKGGEGPALDSGWSVSFRFPSLQITQVWMYPRAWYHKILVQTTCDDIYYISACSWFKLALLSYSRRNKFPNTTCP